MKIHLIKAQRRTDAEDKTLPMVMIGQGEIGELRVPSKEFIKYIDNNSTGVQPDPENIYVYPEPGVYAKIGYPILVGDITTSRWIRTSRIRSVYVHNTNMDKLVLPKEFSREILDGLDMSNLETGTIIYLTMNSIYFGFPVKE